MRALSGLLAGFGIVGVLALVALWAFMIGATIYGWYLAFSASILLGILMLVVAPSATIVGLVMLLFHKNLAQIVLDFLNK